MWILRKFQYVSNALISFSSRRKSFDSSWLSRRSEIQQCCCHTGNLCENLSPWFEIFSYLKVAEAFSATAFQPRQLGALPTNETCHLLGWGQGETRQDAINVYSPEFCDENFPQVFCTTFGSKTDGTCSAIFGSPLTCTDHSAVAGFLITGDETCPISGTRFVLNYHSVGGFQEWVENEISAASYAKMSVALILSAILITARNMM